MSDVPETSSFDLSLAAAVSVERVAALRPAAIEEQVTTLFSLLRDRLLRYLCSLGLPPHDGEEVIQEAFLSLFQHLRANKSQQNIRGWIFRVAHNIGLKKRMANGAQAVTPDTGEFLSQMPHDPTPSPEEQAFFRQRQKRLLAVLDALPSQDRHCLCLRAEGLQYREIAQVLDISLGGVSQSLARTITRLNHADYK
jgi:RNA polymerase sigma-70 factor (ECF subfamily)